jgi:hypothetical protein
MSRSTRTNNPFFQGAFRGPSDEFDASLDRKPVIFDILGPDMETSILPDGYRLVLHVNPNSMTISYAKEVTRTPTRGGFVEQHWGEAANTIDFQMVTGGFMRLYSGLSNVTGGTGSLGADGTRRETLAYDRYLDILALFRSNGAVYDSGGSIVFQGILSVTFDGGTYFGWFSSFGVEESAETPYQFSLTANFLISREHLRMRSPASGG